MDFISGLPLHKGCNAIFTCVDRLTKLTRLTPCFMGDNVLTAVETAQLFFNRIVRDFGIPETIISDRDPRFTSSILVCVDANCRYKAGLQLCISSPI
jgi:hypothetical protein